LRKRNAPTYGSEGDEQPAVEVAKICDGAGQRARMIRLPDFPDHRLSQQWFSGEAGTPFPDISLDQK